MHDVCAVAWVAQPGLFGLVPAWVQVETAWQLTAGMTVTDFEAPGLELQAGGGNARVAMSIDVGTGSWELTLGVYQRVARAMGALSGRSADADKVLLLLQFLVAAQRSRSAASTRLA